jgi:hypothetical protein
MPFKSSITLFKKVNQPVQSVANLTLFVGLSKKKKSKRCICMKHSEKNFRFN